MLRKRQFIDKFAIDIEKIQSKYIREGFKESDFAINREKIIEEEKLQDILYDIYLNDGDYRIFKKTFKSKLNFKKGILDIDKSIHENVVPIVRKKDFMKEGNLLRESFTSDLDILYGERVGDGYQLLLNRNENNLSEVRKLAYKNQNKVELTLGTSYKFPDIYLISCSEENIRTNDFIIDLTPNLFNKSIQRQIKKEIGENYLFAIPTETLTIITKDTPQGMKSLKDAINYSNDSDEVQEQVSKNIYRCIKDSIISYDETNCVKVEIGKRPYFKI
ncbi:MAG: hypothetical protein FH753_18605 [Firmicutes bacterium]|nr:hypothetical protein [Bacillota bacterium]